MHTVRGTGNDYCLILNGFKKGLLRSLVSGRRIDLSKNFRLADGSVRLEPMKPKNFSPRRKRDAFCKVLSYRGSPPHGALFSLRLSVEFNLASLWWGIARAAVFSVSGL
jgi:hypothetical protein